MILLIDNYDSFTYNIVQSLSSLGATVEVRRNDALSAAEAIDMRARGIVLGPGPGRPADATLCARILRLLPAHVPLLGVCLGHQALIEHHGGLIEADREPVHGRPSRIEHDGRDLFQGLPQGFEAGRYHSLHAPREHLPIELEVSAWTREQLVMGVRHRSLPRFGVQFHPESILTPLGDRLLANFMLRCGIEPGLVGMRR